MGETAKGREEGEEGERREGERREKQREGGERRKREIEGERRKRRGREEGEVEDLHIFRCVHSSPLVIRSVGLGSTGIRHDYNKWVELWVWLRWGCYRVSSGKEFVCGSQGDSNTAEERVTVSQPNYPILSVLLPLIVHVEYRHRIPGVIGVVLARLGFRLQLFNTVYCVCVYETECVHLSPLKMRRQREFR